VNYIFLVLIAGSVAWAAVTGKMPAVMAATFDTAKSAVQVAIGLLGALVLFLGIMRILREAGVIHAIARGLGPVLNRLFPDVPPDHPAMGAMIMNMAANILGLGNAATPFGLKAMQELAKLNDRPGVATNAMALFLVINTSGMVIFPLGVIALRASMNSTNPAGIFAPSVLSAFASCIIAVAAALLIARLPAFAAERYEPDPVDAAAAPKAPAAELTVDTDLLAEAPKSSRPRLALLFLFFAVVIVGAVRMRDSEGFGSELLNAWIVPVLMATIVLLGFARRVNVYEAAVRGAREGYDIFVMIIPYLVLLLVAVAMFRASGMLDLLIGAIQPVTALVGFPAEALPMAFIRPLSGSGATGILVATMETYGPDSFVSNLVCVMSGSTETTFYVLAVYYGSIGIRATRHTVPACLVSEVVSVMTAFFFTRLLLG
jgi:spore maturation protein SpmA